jgi:hypothetical protein
LKRAVALTLAFGGVAALLSICLLLTRVIELFHLAAISAFFTFLIAWLNKGSVERDDGRLLLRAGVGLACSSVIIASGWLVAFARS